MKYLWFIGWMFFFGYAVYLTFTSGENDAWFLANAALWYAFYVEAKQNK